MNKLLKYFYYIRNFIAKILDKKFNFLIFFVTSKCNLKCKDCFFWKEINKAGDLTLEEIEKISRSMPKIIAILFSGGEPFLRLDLDKIIEVFYKNNKTCSFSIATNGTLIDEIMMVIKVILEKYQDIIITLNFSLDGFKKKHDDIKGVPGSYTRTVSCLNKLSSLRSKYPNLRITVNTVILKDNIDEILNFAQYIQREFDVDGHYFEIIRGEPKDTLLKDVPYNKLLNLYWRLVKLQSYYIEKIIANDNMVSKFFNKLYYISNFLLLYRYQYRILSGKSRWPMQCLAGVVAGVLDYDGNFKLCELGKNIAKLQDYKYDFKKLWFSILRRKELKRIKVKRCDCTHVCFIDQSYKHSMKVMLFIIPYLYLKYRIFGVKSVIK